MLLGHRTRTSTWSALDRFHLARAPALVITWQEDIIQSYTSKPYFWGIKQAKWVHLDRSSHEPFYEQREKYMIIVEK